MSGDLPFKDLTKTRYLPSGDNCAPLATPSPSKMVRMSPEASVLRLRMIIRVWDTAGEINGGAVFGPCRVRVQFPIGRQPGLAVPDQIIDPDVEIAALVGAKCQALAVGRESGPPDEVVRRADHLLDATGPIDEHGLEGAHPCPRMVEKRPIGADAGSAGVLGNQKWRAHNRELLGGKRDGKHRLAAPMSLVQQMARRGVEGHHHGASFGFQQPANCVPRAKAEIVLKAGRRVHRKEETAAIRQEVRGVKIKLAFGGIRKQSRLEIASRLGDLIEAPAGYRQ